MSQSTGMAGMSQSMSCPFDTQSMAKPSTMLKTRLTNTMGTHIITRSRESTSRSARAMIRPCLVRSK